jgi:hypothetical protein
MDKIKPDYMKLDKKEGSRVIFETRIPDHPIFSGE